MGCCKQREKRWVLDRLDCSGFIKKPVSFSFRKRSTENVVNARIIAEIQRSTESGKPEQNSGEDEGRDARDLQEADQNTLHPRPLSLLMDIAEIKSEENTVLHPTITKVAPSEAHSGLGRGSIWLFSHCSSKA